MTTPDDIFKQAFDNFQQLGLKAMPFTESPIDPSSNTLNNIFTGREKELRQIANLLLSPERRKILIYGRIGIGKSAFLLAVLSAIRRNRPNMLTTYISLPPELDLATTALIAVAKAMPGDEWAQHQLHQLGIPTAQTIKERTTEASISMLAGAKLSEKAIAGAKSQYPTVSLDVLLERAQKKFPDGIMIAIDDLDKQNSSRVRQLMHDAQGMLKGRAWFMLTGHPTGMTGDLLTSERGLFDLQLQLEELDQETTYKMLIKYLNSARRGKEKYEDPTDPRSVLPFVPETAREFCRVSMGKPRLFNRLGNTVLSTAADLQATSINADILNQGLQQLQPTLLHQAALTAQEERVRMLLQQRGNLSDETISLEDLTQLGFRSFVEIVPILERLEAADLAHQLNQADATSFAPMPLPPSAT